MAYIRFLDSPFHLFSTQNQKHIGKAHKHSEMVCLLFLDVKTDEDIRLTFTYIEVKNNLNSILDKIKEYSIDANEDDYLRLEKAFKDFIKDVDNDKKYKK